MKPILLLLVLSLSACSSYKTLAERREVCAEKFVKLDVRGIEAAKMCEKIHTRNKLETSVR